MLATIADHIKTHRHQLRHHALFIGSAVVVPPRDLSVQSLMAEMAVEWAGQQIADVPPELRAEKALALMAEHVPDHAQRCRLLAAHMAEARPAEGHIRLSRMIKDGYFSTIFMAEPDRLLEQALEVHHLHPEKDYRHFVAGVHEPEIIKLGVEESSRMSIIKCCGDIESKFLPLTPEEIAPAYAAIADIITDVFKAFTVITAYDDRDRPFLDHVPSDGRRIFWVNNLVPVSDQRHFDELKIESPASVQYHRYQPEVVSLLSARASARHLICREAGTFNDFMAKLHERLDRRRPRSHRRKRDLTLLRGGPYRFLDHFDVEDVDFFFGREEDTRTLIGMIENSPVVVLFGRSGIGKTSLLRAGVMARLSEKSTEDGDDEESAAGFLCVYARSLDDPVDSMKEATIAAVDELGYETVTLRGDCSLLALVHAVHALTDRRIVFIVDQFEEYFVRLGDRVKEEFLEAWTECTNAGLDYVHWIIGIREDFVGHLHDLHTHIPGMMHNMYRLKKLTREQAKDAIVKPAQNFEIQFESELIEQILEDLSREGIEPAQLQIVCDRLYEAKPGGQHTIGLHSYKQLGRAERILSEYLDYALSQFNHLDRRVARAILARMVSSSEVLAVSSIQRIAEQLGYSRDEIERVTAKLVDFRLLRGVGEERSRQYELVHEYLAHEIEDWMSDTEIKLKDVQDLVARELNNYHKFGLLMHAEELKIINDQRDKLQLSPEELELVIRSVAERGGDAEYWFSRLDELGNAQVALVRSLINDGNAEVQLAAANAIAATPSVDYLPDLIRALDSPNGQLVEIATETLAHLERSLISLLAADDKSQRVRAIVALGAIESHRAIPRLLEAIPAADEVVRDAIADTLAKVDDRSASETLLRRMASREGISWPGAYILATLATRDEDALRKLRRLVRRYPGDAKGQYTVGLADLYMHEMGNARQHLELAASVASSDGQGAAQIAAALGELEAQAEKLAEGTEVWPCFQGDSQHSGVSGHELAPPLKQVWRFETKGPVLSSPVVSAGLVFLGSRDGALYAVDAVRGTQQWKLQTGDQIEATAAVVGDFVYVGSHDGFVYAADTTSGVAQWKTALGRATRSSPVVAEDKLFIGDHAGRLTAMAADTGRIIWQAQTRADITQCPAVADGTIIIGSWDGDIYAFDADDGTEQWTYPTQGPVASTPTVRGGYVCCGSDDANVYALDIATGEAVWKRPVGGYTRSSAAATDRLFIMGCHDGRVYALDHDTGDIVWRAETGDEILASAAISGEVLYIGSIDGALYAIKLDTGEIVWQHKTLYGIYSSPAVVGDMLYIGIEHYHLAAFASADNATT